MSKIAVYLPGIGYHCDKPLLYYGRKVACVAGYDRYVNISYEYSGFDIKNEECMRNATLELLKQAMEQLHDINWDEYDEILFVAKSIGTILAAKLADDLKRDNLKMVLFTPLIQTYQWQINNAIAFLGTRDRFSKAENIKELADKNEMPLYIYENCNHSLETEDTFVNLAIMKDVLGKMSEFIAK